MSYLSDASVCDALQDTVLVVDAGGALREWNRATVDVTGRDEVELSGATLAELFGRGDARKVREALSGTGGVTVEAALESPAGAVPYEFAVDELDEDGSDSSLFVLVGRRVTDDRRSSTEQERRERVLREMYEIISDPDRPFEAQVEALLELARTELGTRYATFSQIRGDEYVFEAVATAEGDDSIQQGDVVPVSATNCEIAANTEKTLVLGDVARDAPDLTDREGYTEWGISCYIGAPVFEDDDVYGTFCCYDTEAREGQFSEWEVTLVDLMSRWVSYELERRRTTRRLERQNERLEAFAEIVSHDLRNPLSVLSGGLALAAETGESAEFERCREAITRMESLIDSLLDLARAGRVVDDPEPVELRPLAETAWDVVPTAHATLTVETDAVVRADPQRLRQLLENLFRNAVEHGGEDVAVTVGNLGDDGFYVADDGVGIPEADREEVLQSGFSTTEDGTGMGLAIVDEVATAHGWRVTVTDGPDGGARFEFRGVETARSG